MTLRRLPLAMEAFGALAVASLLIALFDFKRIVAMATRGGGTRAADPGVARDIAWALTAWGRRVPWRAVCFQQGLAAHLMLRRRGLSAKLFYGAKRDDAGMLVAHVWVRSGTQDVIGCDNADSYGVLGVFPAER